MKALEQIKIQQKQNDEALQQLKITEQKNAEALIRITEQEKVQ